MTQVCKVVQGGQHTNRCHRLDSSELLDRPGQGRSYVGEKPQMTPRYLTVGTTHFNFERLEMKRLHVITGNNYDKHDKDERRRSFWRRMLSRAYGGRGRRLFVTHRVIKREAPTSRKRKLRRMRQSGEGCPWFHKLHCIFHRGTQSSPQIFRIVSRSPLWP